jgi:uncharacterized protein
VRAVVVAMVHRLHEHDAEVQPHEPAIPLLINGVVWRGPARGIHQLVSASNSVFAQDRKARGGRIALIDVGLGAREPAEVALLGGEEVQEGGRDASVGAGSGELQLVIGQLRADVQQVQVCPLVVAKRLDQQRVQNPLDSNLISCQGMALDTLQARGRSLALYERYGALLTDHQREVVDLYLRSDWSLAEIAEHQGTSRAAVHDLVRRSTLAMQEYERRLGLLAESARRRRALEALERELDGLKRRVVRLEGAV